MTIESCRDTATLEGCAESLVRCCETEDRFLVSWSRFGLETIEKHLPPALAARFAAVHGDGKVPAKKWKRRVHPDVSFRAARFQPRNRLDNHLGLIDYHVPPHLGDQQAAQLITFVREQLASYQAELLNERGKTVATIEAIEAEPDWSNRSALPSICE